MQNKNCKFDLSDFKVIEQINQGTYSVVYSIRNTKTEEIYAAKVLKQITSDEEEARQAIENEVRILKMFDHPTIVHFYGFSSKDLYGSDNYTMIFDYFKNGSLSNVLERVRNGTCEIIFDNTIRQIILIGIARGMMLLHQRRIIHRDLKPGNVLIDDNYNPHITDFGMSQSFENYEPMLSTSGDFGSPAYIAPEIIDEQTYTTKVDVYSFGILMYEVVTGSLPYPNIKSSYQLKLKVLNDGLRPEFSIPVKPSLQSLIEKCWHAYQDKRPTFEELFYKLALGKDPVIDDDDDERYFLENVDKEAIKNYVNTISDSLEIQQEVSRYHIVKVEPKEKNEKYRERIEQLERKIVKIERIEQLEKEVEKMRNIFDEYENKIKKKMLLIDDKFQIFSSLLETADIPENFNQIPSELFINCTKLKKVTIPPSIFVIGSYAFAGCISLTDVSIPTSVTKIQKYAFADCTSLKKIVVPSSVTSIEMYAFKKCESLIEFVIPDSITIIDKFVFGNCSSLCKITIPPSVTKIEIYAFKECISLKKLIIPNSVVLIRRYAFKKCTSLEYIEMSRDTFVDNESFDGCSLIKKQFV